MTDKTIDEAACRLADDSKVIARIEELTEELKYRNMATVEKVISQLSKIAFSDIKDMLSFKTVKTVNEDLTALTGTPIIAYKTVIDLKDSDDVDGSLIAEVKETKDGFSFKRNDQMKALELIGKHLGMFTDNLKLSGGTTNINIELSPEDYAAVMKADMTSPEGLELLARIKKDYPGVIDKV
jgi:phage terminase small subunit